MFPPIIKILLIVVPLAFAGCATAIKQPSLFDTNPTLLTKQYTPNEIKEIEQGFKTNPLQYSQELGNLKCDTLENFNYSTQPALIRFFDGINQAINAASIPQ